MQVTFAAISYICGHRFNAPIKDQSDWIIFAWTLHGRAIY